jgi:hypothetical protein
MEEPVDSSSPQLRDSGTEVGLWHNSPDEADIRIWEPVTRHKRAWHEPIADSGAWHEPIADSGAWHEPRAE